MMEEKVDREEGGRVGVVTNSTQQPGVSIL